MKELFQSAADALKEGRSIVLCSVIASSGSTPRGAGAKMIVFEDGHSIGTIGGGAVEHVSTGIAKEAHKARASHSKGFILAKNDVADLGMICGGNVTVYFQYLAAENEQNVRLVERINEVLAGDEDAWLITAVRENEVGGMGVYTCSGGLEYLGGFSLEEIKPLFRSRAVLKRDEPSCYVEPIVQSGVVYVFGGGHVSQELIPVLAHIGFRPVVFEDREQFADIALFPGAIDCVLGDFKDVGKTVRIRPEDYVVIMTRGHQADYEVLEQALRTGATYVGVIGSRNKMALTRKRLLAAGIPEEGLSRIHNPIGTAIKAETPAEIAISVAGELILHRAEQRGL
ncbi:MAG: XdhC family protein [Bacillota bacterium]